MEQNTIKVRFAPSPTGELHLGGARTALFNWLFAQSYGGQFFLRIEDTDTNRSKEKYSDQILDALEWLGLKWNNPLVYQSKRFDDYKIHIANLLGTKNVYRCFCSKDDLEFARKEGHYQYSGKCRNLKLGDIKKSLNQGIGFTYRLKVPQGKTYYEDMIYGPISVDNAELDDFIIVRSDGSPTYNFTAVIDDHDMNISHIIRGEDHISNTPKQILLYKALGFDIPTFAHLPMILGNDKKRLSKRHGAPGVQNFRDEGYLPESLNNYLALLGWNPGTKEEILSMNELVQKFNLAQVQKKGAVYDEKKLHWISGQHMMKTKTDFILKSIRVVDPEWGRGSNISYLIAVIEILKQRAKSLTEFIGQSKYFFQPPDEYDRSGIKKGWPNEEVNERMKKIQFVLEKISLWRRDNIETALKSYAESNGLNMGKIIMPIRLAVSGNLNGPNVFDILSLIGKESIINRIENALKELPK